MPVESKKMSISQKVEIWPLITGSNIDLRLKKRTTNHEYSSRLVRQRRPNKLDMPLESWHIGDYGNATFFENLSKPLKKTTLTNSSPSLIGFR